MSLGEIRKAQEEAKRRAEETEEAEPEARALHDLRIQRQLVKLLERDVERLTEKADTDEAEIARLIDDCDQAKRSAAENRKAFLDSEIARDREREDAGLVIKTLEADRDEWMGKYQRRPEKVVEKVVEKPSGIRTVIEYDPEQTRRLASIFGVILVAAVIGTALLVHFL